MNLDKKRVAHVLVFSALSILFALMASSLGYHYKLKYPGYAFSIGIDFPVLYRVLIGISLLSAIPVIVAFVRQLAAMNLLPQSFAHRFAMDDSSRRPLSRTPLPSRMMFIIVLFACTLSILLLVTFIQKSGAIEDDILNGKMYEITSLIRGKHIRTHTSTHVIRAAYLTTSSDYSDYLQEAFIVVRTLKDAGARAVLLPLPEVPMLAADMDFPGLQRLDSLGIVVFGTKSAVRFWNRDGLNFSLGSYEIADPVVNDQNYGRPHLYSRFTLFESGSYPFLYDKTDVLIPFLLKYRGNDNSDAVDREEGALFIGEDRIPLVSPNMMYSKNNYDWTHNIDYAVSMQEPWTLQATMMAPKRKAYSPLTIGAQPPSVRFSPWFAHPPGPGAPPPFLTNDQVRESVNGKAVILTSNFGRSGYEHTMLLPYSAAFENILAREFISKPKYGAVWSSGTVLLLAGIFAFVFRPLLAVVCSLALGFATIFAGSLCYDNLNLLIDIFYPLLSLGIASFAFPLLKFAITASRSIDT